MTMSLHVSTPRVQNRLAAALRSLRPHLTIERTREAARDVRVANLMINIEWPILQRRRSLAFYLVQRSAPASPDESAQ